MASANRTVQNFQSRLKRAARVGAAALAAIGGASVKMASDFEREMTKVVTLVGLGSERVQGMRSEILQMAKETGQAPKALAQGLFRMTSGGIRGADALKQLRSAAKAASVGMGDLASLVRTATTAANAFPGSDLTQVLNTMLLTVREGQIRVNRFQRALSQVQAPAAEVGVEFNQLAAFLATASRVMGGTQKAARGLRSMLARLQDPPGAMAEAFQKAQIPIAQFREMVAEEGLASAFTVLANRAEKFDVSIAKLAGSTRAWAAITSVAGNQIDTFNTIMGRMEDSAGAVQKAFEETEKTTSLTFRQMVASIKAAAVQLGNELAPAADEIAEAFSSLASIIGTVAQGFGALPGPIQELTLAVGGLGTALTPVLIGLNQLVGLLTALQAATGASSMLGGLAQAVGGLGSSLAGLVPLVAVGGSLLIGFKALQGVLRETKQQSDNLRQSVDELKTKVTDMSKEALTEWHRKTHNARFQAKEMRKQVDQMIGKFGASATITEEMAKKLGDASLEGRVLSDVQTALANQVDRLNTLLEAQSGQLQDMQSSGDEAATSLELARQRMREMEGGVTIPLEVTAPDQATTSLADISVEGVSPEKVKQVRRRMQTLRQSLQTEAERIRAQLEQVRFAMNKGIIPQDQGKQMQARLRKQLQEATGEVSRFQKVFRSGAKKLGQALIEGIITGADNMKDVLKRFLVRLASTFIMGQLTGFLGIASPSKKGILVGESLVQGMIAGMQGMERRLAQTSTRMAAAATPSIPGVRAGGGFAGAPAGAAGIGGLQLPASGGGGGGGREVAARIAEAFSQMPRPDYPSPEAAAAAEYEQRKARKALEIAASDGFDVRLGDDNRTGTGRRGGRR